MTDNTKFLQTEHTEEQNTSTNGQLLELALLFRHVHDKWLWSVLEQKGPLYSPSPVWQNNMILHFMRGSNRPLQSYNKHDILLNKKQAQLTRSHNVTGCSLRSSHLHVHGYLLVAYSLCCCPHRRPSTCHLHQGPPRRLPFRRFHQGTAVALLLFFGLLHHDI